MRVEPTKYICEQFRATFKSPGGREVLQYLLYHLGFWVEARTDEERVKKNVALHILEIMAGGDPDALTEHIVDKSVKLVNNYEQDE